MRAMGPIQMQRQIRAYLSDGRLMEAMVLAKAAVRGLPEWLEFRMLLAEVYVQRGAPKKAIAELEALLAIDPEFPGARPAHDRLTLPADVLLARLRDS